ncbi:uncharacterized protein [Temnothorax nylanderi]|uniref:uncharacterized protein n=1 Tax=Temnothorax nylanderi TaxID=102681 RepID=UPI003A87CCD3
MNELRERQTQSMRAVDHALDNFRKIGKKNLTPAKIRNRISALKDIWVQIQNGHFALLAATPAADRPADDYFRESQYEACEEAYQAAFDYMAECLEELDPYVSPNQSFESGHHPLGSSSAFSLSNLPPITLPPFNGNYDEWETFRDRFTSLIINNKDLSNFSRMHFLVSCLKDRALECVKDINVTADNFAIAWNTLNTRFENKRRLINVHMSTLLNLPTVARESAVELQTLRDKINTAVAALSKLNRSPEELWSDILVNLGSLKLDTVTRKAWNLKYSEERIPPAYEDFSKFLDNRIRALEEWKLPLSPADRSKPASVQKINSAAASAQSPPPCSLCKLKHQFSACPQFVSKSPSQRRDLVRKENRCFNCMRKGHAVQASSSKFTCRLCQRKHHTTLHLDSDSQPKALDVVPTSQPSQPDTTTKE